MYVYVHNYVDLMGIELTNIGALFKIPESFHLILVGKKNGIPRSWIMTYSPINITGQYIMPEAIINQPSFINYIHLYPYIFPLIPIYPYIYIYI